MINSIEDVTEGLIQLNENLKLEIKELTEKIEYLKRINNLKKEQLKLLQSQD